MAMPQGHLVAFCSDLGIAGSRGAAMLSVLLGIAFISRQFWGWSRTASAGCARCWSARLQAVAMVAFLVTQDEVGLFTVSAALRPRFQRHHPGLCAGGARAVSGARSVMADADVLFSSGTGMAAGGWLAGLLYDHYGFYGPAFATGIAFNLLNLMLVGILVLRQREHAK